MTKARLRAFDRIKHDYFDRRTYQTTFDYFTGSTTILSPPFPESKRQDSLSPALRSNCDIIHNGTVLRKDSDVVVARDSTVTVPEGKKSPKKNMESLAYKVTYQVGNKFIYPECHIDHRSQEVLEHPLTQEPDRLRLPDPTDDINYSHNITFSYETVLESEVFVETIEEPWLEPCVEPTPEMPDPKLGDFVNPTVERPVSAMKFIQFMDFNPLESILDGLYSEDPRPRNRLKYDPVALLKALIYLKLKSYPFLTNLHQDLVSIEGLAEKLGFNDGIPTYRELHHFANERLGVDGIKRLFDEMVRINLKEMKKNGIEIEDVALDASPIRACEKDPDGQVNGHYYQTYKIHKCYLWHNLRDMRTRLPLVFHLAGGNDDEGKFLLPFLAKAKVLGINPRKAYVDNGYSSKENIASTKVHFGIDIVTNMSIAWKYKKHLCDEVIEAEYSKLWKEPFFVRDADFETKLMILIGQNNGKNNRLHNLVGDYYRNEYFARYEESPDGYMDDYHLRNGVESTHGTEKRLGSIKRTEVRGVENNTVQLGLHLLMLHMVAHTRLQNGIQEGLTDIGYIR